MDVRWGEIIQNESKEKQRGGESPIKAKAFQMACNIMTCDKANYKWGV